MNKIAPISKENLNPDSLDRDAMFQPKHHWIPRIVADYNLVEIRQPGNRYATLGQLKNVQIHFFYQINT